MHETRGARSALWSPVVVLLLCALPAPAAALRPCQPPSADSAAALVWPGWKAKAKVPVDAALFLRLTVAPGALRVWLAPKGKKGGVALRLTRIPGLGLYAARSAKPFSAGTYDLWVRAPEAWHPGPPKRSRSTRDVKLYPPITVHKKRAGNTLPVVRKARVRFGPWGARSGDMRRLRRAGRKVYLVLGKSAPAPALIAVEGVYTAGAQRWEVSDVLAHGEQVQIGSTHLDPCAQRKSLMRAAPRRGRYKLKITPWAVSGAKGKPMEISGDIRTDPKLRNAPP